MQIKEDPEILSRVINVDGKPKTVVTEPNINTVVTVIAEDRHL